MFRYILFLSLFVACGEKKSVTTSFSYYELSPQERLEKGRFERPHFSYYHFDRESATSGKLGKQTVCLFEHYSYACREEDLSSFNQDGEEGVVGKTISKMGYGRTRVWNQEGRELFESIPSKKFFLGKSYERNDIQMIGANILYLFSKVDSFLTVRGHSLPPIEVELEYREKEVNGKYLVDNAYHVKRFSSSGARELVYQLRITPQSKEGFDSSELRVWESPFVIYHEYGHHIFAYYQNEFVVNMLTGGKTLDKGFRFMMLALDEGMADLFAYIMTGGDESSLPYIPCMANRSVEKNLGKKLNRKDLKRFLSGEKERMSCHRINPTTIHGVGSIFAAYVHALFPNRGQKISIYFEMMDFLKAHSHKEREGEELLRKCVAFLQKNAIEKGILRNDKLEDVTLAYFPFLEGELP